ncbi:asparaginase [Alicycliphilus denitrificans]|uniref:asparaginase n=1 Tax=Alicycliphilus denitrificans TaxID=179636 RepID=UPI0001DA1306|nr:asparaginase [Alicycliphilus denitrificans]ADV00939.1 Asparaginase [Alicycliphilus denitrificans BC]
MPPIEPHRCALITTGGTIVSRIDPATGLAMPVLSGDELLSTLRGHGDPGEVEVHDFCRVASPHIGPREWVGLSALAQSLAAREDVAGIVVTHGTSTLEDTAWFLDLVLRTEKPVVVTGAQRNASAPDFDGPRNLLTALKICRAPAARGLGVLVALNEHVNAAREATKTHTVDVETFQSGEWGYLGSVVNDRVTFHRAPARRLHIPLTASALPPVEIVSMYPGASGALITAAADAGARGIVVQAVASGHVNEAMAGAIGAVLARGVAVAVATRIPRGGTRAGYGFPGSSQRLAEAGAVLAGDLSPWKARIVLMLALQRGPVPAPELARLFDQ